jgi:hypothetical protein
MPGPVGTMPAPLRAPAFPGSHLGEARRMALGGGVAVRGGTGGSASLAPSRDAVSGGCRAWIRRGPALRGVARLAVGVDEGETRVGVGFGFRIGLGLDIGLGLIIGLGLGLGLGLDGVRPRRVGNFALREPGRRLGREPRSPRGGVRVRGRVSRSKVALEPGRPDVGGGGPGDGVGSVYGVRPGNGVGAGKRVGSGS